MTASTSNLDQRSTSCCTGLNFEAAPHGSLQQDPTMDSRGSSCLTFPAQRRLQEPQLVRAREGSDPCPGACRGGLGLGRNRDDYGLIIFPLGAHLKGGVSSCDAPRRTHFPPQQQT